MLITTDEGIIANNPELAEDVRAAGYIKCHNSACDFWISPEAQNSVAEAGGYYTCPRCKKSYNLLYELPWQRPGIEDYYDPSIRTNSSGLTVVEVGQIGETIIQELGELPGYGPIIWWHSSDTLNHSPIDGATKDWAIEVKTLLYDALHHRFIAGGDRPRAGETYSEREMKNKAAEEMGKNGVLGLLVMLDMRRSIADIYAKEMPLGDWSDSQGKIRNGIVHFRTNTAEHLIAEVPFKNPYTDPNHPAPHGPEMAVADNIPF